MIEAAGLRWHVERTGSGPALLLIHGTGASTHTWRRMIPLLAQHHEVVAVDLPGHGRTGTPGAAGTSIAGMSRGIAALLRRLQVEPSHAVGHSAGAVILCRMALDHLIAPRVIVSLNGAFVPLAGMAGIVFSPIARALAGSVLLPRFLAWRAGNPANVARVIAGTGSRLDAESLGCYSALVRDPKHVAGALTMMGNWDLSGFYRDLPSLKTPLALIVADNDRTVPPRQALLVQQRVPHATILRLAGLGHLAHEEEPALVAREILRICAVSAPAAASTEPCGPPIRP